MGDGVEGHTRTCDLNEENKLSCVGAVTKRSRLERSLLSDRL